MPDILCNGIRVDIGYIHGLGGVHTTFMNTLGVAGIVGASASTESMVNVAMEKYWRLNNMINHLKQSINLVPDCQNPTPDYFCTWQVQLYSTSDGKTIAQRNVMDENHLFGTEAPCGWAYFFEKTRNDLILLLDSGWDVDVDNVLEMRGSHILNKGKFPSFYADNATPAEALKRLAERIEEIGWKGLGLWVASEECEKMLGNGSVEDYWKERLQMSKQAGIKYWKVDNGKKREDSSFRSWLSHLGKNENCGFIIENAVVERSVSYSDVYRLYDVHPIAAIPMTLEKVYNLRYAPLPSRNFSRLVTSDDEIYISAGLGFAFEVLRHPFVGDMPNGKKDCAFPEIQRNVKTKLTEITRVARWHRISPAFAFDPEATTYSEEFLYDEWRFENYEDEIEDWWLKTPSIRYCLKNNILRKGAPAAITREMTPPVVIADENGMKPFITASRNPNGTISIASLGRTIDRSYFTPRCDITLFGEKTDCFGVFGYFGTLNIKTELLTEGAVILMQDLADEVSYDITDRVKISDNTITIPGELIEVIGTLAQPEGDTSEPGVVIRIMTADTEK